MSVCDLCSNTARQKSCQLFCTQHKAEVDRKAQIDLDNAKMGAISRRLHDLHRHKRW